MPQTSFSTQIGSFDLKKLGVASKTILAVALILLVTAGVQIFISYRSSSRQVQLEAEHTLISRFETYRSKILAEQQAAEAMAIGIASRTDVQTLYLEGDREALYDLLSPMFEQWKAREIVHLYVENPDGTVFLRVHNPANFGDDITYRNTALTALKEQRTTSGLEIGPNRMGIRAVTPMYDATGTFIGLVEVGIDFDDKFVADFKELTNSDLTMWVTYDAAAAPQLKPVEGSPAAPIDDLFYYTSTNPSLPVADETIYKSVLTTRTPQFVLNTENTSIPTIYYITPLLGYNDKLLGILQFSESYTTNLQSQSSSLRFSLGLVGGLTLLSLLLIWLFTSEFILRPLSALTQFAEKQTTGNVGARVTLKSTDEFGELAQAFNTLAQTVEEERKNLEERITARTKDLETVAEVGTVTSTILETTRLLQAVVDLTKERFNLYHSHVYLLDESGENLVLTAGAGEPGRIMASEKRSIPLHHEKSLVARTAREQKGVTVNDVTKAPDFLPNPLLPNTRSELAVPMLIGDTLIGVFDIQSDTIGRFTESDVNIQTTLAAQLASSVQNARSYERSKSQAEFESLLNSISQKIQRAESVEDTLQTAIRELGSALGASRVKAVIAGYQNNSNTN